MCNGRHAENCIAHNRNTRRFPQSKTAARWKSSRVSINPQSKVGPAAAKNQSNPLADYRTNLQPYSAVIQALVLYCNLCLRSVTLISHQTAPLVCFPICRLETRHLSTQKSSGNRVWRHPALWGHLAIPDTSP